MDSSLAGINIILDHLLVAVYVYIIVKGNQVKSCEVCVVYQLVLCWQSQITLRSISSAALCQEN